MIRRLLMLALCLCTAAPLASPVAAQSVADRAKARGDSLLAVAKCWRFAKAPDVAVPVSSCPDSAEAVTTMLPHAPVMHIDRMGQLCIHLQVGQVLALSGWSMRGYLFIWPAGVDSKGWRQQGAQQLGRATIPRPFPGTIPVAPPDALGRII